MSQGTEAAISSPLNHSVKGQSLPQSTPKLYPYRYVCFLVYCMMALVNAFAIQTFVAVSIQITELYDTSLTIINFAALAYPLAHSFVVFPANYILDQMGLKAGLTVGSGFIILGYLVRVLLVRGFWLYILGTYITAMGYIYILNGTTKFTSNWFGVRETTIANSIILFFLFGSNALGLFVTVLFVDEHSSKKDVERYIVLQSGVIIGIHLLGLLFIRDKPPSPANYSSQKKKERFWFSIKQLVKNRNYVILFLSIMTVWGCISAFFTTLEWQLKPYGHNSTTVGLIVICANGMGLVGCVVFGVYVQNTKKYKRVLTGCLTLGILFLCMFWVTLQTIHSPVGLYVWAGCIGFVLFPFFTTMMDLSNQVAFPIGESTSSGFLLCGGQLFGFGLGLAMPLLFDGKSFDKTRIGTGIYVMTFVAGWIVLLFYKEDLRKLNYERQMLIDQDTTPRTDI